MIFLRPLNISDVERLYEIKSNPLNFEYINFNTSIVTPNYIKEWLYNIPNELDAIRLAIVLSDVNIIIGSITLGKIDYIASYCEIHIYIDKIYQNKGYGKLSLLIAINYIKNILKIKTISLDVQKNNIRAIKLYNDIGFISINENDLYIKMTYNIT